MIKIGVIGMGNIQQKAYLPITTARNTDVEWIYFTRNQTKLKDLQDKYHLETCTSDLDVFFSYNLDACFVHTPTETHAYYIDLLLDRGIHVLVDKPISDSIHEVERLIEKSREKNCILMTGFNRRFAPMTRHLKNIEKKHMIILQKNREAAAQDAHYALFDMMIHMVDTAVFLLDEPIVSINYSVKKDNQNLRYAMAHLQTENTSALAVINMFAGCRSETFEVIGHDGRYVVENLEKLTVTQGSKLSMTSPSDWESTLSIRGFEAMIDTFIERIQNQDTYDALDLEKTLQSHAIIHALTQE